MNKYEKLATYMMKEGFKTRIILKTLYSIAEEFEEGEDYEEGVHVQEAIQHIAKNTFLKKEKAVL